MALILVVDDEPDIRSVLEYNLRLEGHQVLLARNGEEALNTLQARTPDLVLLDLMLPDVSGTEVCRQIRMNPQTARVPVMMVTARTGEVDRVVGFELGADDYVTKPFSPREVVLRVKAILRRAEEAPSPANAAREIGVLRMDWTAHRVFVKGREVELTPTEFRLLNLFIERLDRVQSREVLLEEVWGGNIEGGTRTVDTHVARLRSKLGPAGRYIDTVRGSGYRLKPPEE